MRRFRLAIVLTIMAFILISGLPLRSQTQGRVYEPFVPTPEYLAAFDLIDKGYIEEGVQAYSKIAALNPGTTLGAVCLEQQAQWTEQSIPIYQKIITDYPRSRFEIGARLSLITAQFGQDGQAKLQATDQLAQLYGGPALREILLGNRSAQLSAQIRALPIEAQVGLYAVYTSEAGCLTSRLKQYKEALPLALFNRQTFFMFDNSGQLLRDLEWDWVQSRGEKWGDFKLKFIDPKLRVLSHTEGVTGPRPRFTFEMATGPFPDAQIDINSSTIMLDSLDLKQALTLRSQVKFSRTKGVREHKPFEVLRLSGRLAQALAPGHHKLTFVIQTENYRGQGPGIKRLSIDFRVARDRDDRDDEREDDRDDREDWGDGWD